MDIHKIAEQLRIASETKQSIAPIRDVIGIDNIDIAYQIQQINTDFKVQKGARIVGKKIGLTSLSVQKQIGVDQPDYGMLFHDMEVHNGLFINTEELMQPKVEAEIAFVLGADLKHDHITISDVIHAIDYCVPSIEIVGSRIADWNIRITDTIADNASASHFVLGHQPRKLGDFDIVNCKMKMSVNDKVVSKGKGSDCLGSPINAALWLAKQMVAIGQPLMKGEIIMSGALGPMAPVKKGDVVQASFKGLGAVSVSFS